jgi:hypothetical protein
MSYLRHDWFIKPILNSPGILPFILARSAMAARKTSARNPASASYDIGYGKPPRHTQFRKGQSGNPGGRRPHRPVERMKELALQEACRMVMLARKDGVHDPVAAMLAILRSQGGGGGHHNPGRRRRTHRPDSPLGGREDAAATTPVTKD